MTDFIRYSLLGGALGIFIGVCRVVDWSEVNANNPTAQQIRRTIGMPTILGLVGGPVVGYFAFKASTTS
jgi:hypothetical protein